MCAARPIAESINPAPLPPKPARAAAVRENRASKGGCVSGLTDAQPCDCRRPALRDWFEQRLGHRDARRAHRRLLRRRRRDLDPRREERRVPVLARRHQHHVLESAQPDRFLRERVDESLLRLARVLQIELPQRLALGPSLVDPHGAAQDAVVPERVPEMRAAQRDEAVQPRHIGLHTGRRDRGTDHQRAQRVADEGDSPHLLAVSG